MTCLAIYHLIIVIFLFRLYNGGMEGNKDRTILHCDMNGFYASVEILDRPELADVPMAVSGNPDNRHGIILAKNELAKKCGVVTPETIGSAKKKCPDLVLVPPHHKKYAHYSRLINEIYYRYTNMVEPFSIDESWLDVSASEKLFGSGKEIADSIRHTVKKELGLTLSAGVSFNKIFAKMGSEYKKPDATTIISRSNYKEMLWPLPVGELFTCGKSTAEKLIRSGITTIGDLALADKTLLVALLGEHGGKLHEYANGEDESPVSFAYERSKIKTVGHGITFKRNLENDGDIRIGVTALSDRVSARLRRYGMKAGGVKVEIKDPDFKVISRQVQLHSPSSSSDEISRAALRIISNEWPKGKPIRLITITGINLYDQTEPLQLDMYRMASPDAKRSESIGNAMDEIRKKFGDSSITFGSIIDNDLGIVLDSEEDFEKED